MRRVVAENGAVTGIEVEGQPGGSRLISCRKEVIVCGGSVNTPKLLLLSGIGPADELRRHGIGVADVRQVGRNLQNHPGVDLQYAARREDSLTAELTALGRARIGADWMLRRKGLGTTNFFETGAFLRTRDDAAFPNMQYEFLPLTRCLDELRLTCYSSAYLSGNFNPALEGRVRRSELIRQEARRQGVEWKQVDGTKHDTFWLGSVKIPIPRHAEIGQRTTEDILHECEAELGKGWWRT